MIELLVAGWLGAVATTEGLTFVRLHMMLRRFHARKLLSTPSMVRDMPSVSVCIPARNEKHAMTRCLESVLSSTYPKMEVLVLDDESVDNTSSLIKSFAKDGVRFIEGGTPPEGWVGKNHALRTLLKEASGTYVLYLDVDTVLSVYSISQLVSYAETTRADMISVLPQRNDVWRASVLLAPLRYFWHVLFHRAARPVVASSAWMVRRKDLLRDFEDFSQLKDDVEPEVTIARQYLAKNSYKFLTSHQLLGVSYEKKMSSQIETTIRLRYPQLHFSLFRAVAVACCKAMIALTPLIAFIDTVYIAPAILVYLGGAICYLSYLLFVWERGALIGMWLWPLVLLGDAWLTLVSMIRYQTGTVTWKGRPIISRSR
ncbi:glycosyltransferase family 2 protein [Candidatus Saccharibacteria bacterium]|nr:glycosyltransferase family 2 protein [Candidatus Saccharibacteria bacterium]